MTVYGTITTAILVAIPVAFWVAALKWDMPLAAVPAALFMHAFSWSLAFIVARDELKMRREDREPW